MAVGIYLQEAAYLSFRYSGLWPHFESIRISGMGTLADIMELYGHIFRDSVEEPQQKMDGMNFFCTSSGF